MKSCSPTIFSPEKIGADKAGSPEKKESKAKKEKTQRERFIETAREIGVDESGREFAVLFRKVVKPRSK